MNGYVVKVDNPVSGVLFFALNPIEFKRLIVFFEEIVKSPAFLSYDNVCNSFVGFASASSLRGVKSTDEVPPEIDNKLELKPQCLVKFFEGNFCRRCVICYFKFIGCIDCKILNLIW